MQPFQVGLCDNGKTYILINEYVKLGIQNSLMTLHHYRDNISYQDKTVVNDIYSHVVLVIRGEISANMTPFHKFSISLWLVYNRLRRFTIISIIKNHYIIHDK